MPLFDGHEYVLMYIKHTISKLSTDDANSDYFPRNLFESSTLGNDPVTPKRFGPYLSMEQSQLVRRAEETPAMKRSRQVVPSDKLIT